MNEAEFEDRLSNALSHINLESMSVDSKKWHTDKGIPIAIVLMFAGQLVIGGWVASAIASDVDNNTKVSTKNAVKIEKAEQKDRELITGTALIKQSIKSNHDDIQEIKATVKENATALYQIQRKMDLFIGSQ